LSKTYSSWRCRHDSGHWSAFEFCFAELKDPVKDKLKRFGLFPQIGEPFFFPTIGVAVSTYLESHKVIGWIGRIALL
jgi:hypothetical protein